MEAENKGSLLAAGTSVFMAVLASACCWLPLLFVSLGLSAAGVSAGLERWRPVFLVATAAFLAGGFYLAYRRPKCEPGTACATPNNKLQRLNRGTLWCAAVVVVLFALFPNYAGNVLRAVGPESEVSVEGKQVVLGVTGMTCDACSVHVERELLRVPGVLSAAVSHAEKSATVQIDAKEPPSVEALISAVERAGYTAKLAHKP